MNPPLDLEYLGNHEYLLRTRQDDDAIEVLIRADPGGITGSLAADADESSVIVAAVGYLLTRQRPDELPAYLDIDDIAAAYDEFPDYVRRQLDPGSDRA